MSQSLPGNHYCLAHQGNHSHYDKINCVVCRLTNDNAALRAMLEADRGVSADILLLRYRTRIRS
jgi:hypothetical protein